GIVKYHSNVSNCHHLSATTQPHEHDTSSPSTRIEERRMGSTHKAFSRPSFTPKPHHSHPSRPLHFKTNVNPPMQLINTPPYPRYLPRKINLLTQDLLGRATHPHCIQGALHD